MVERVLRERPYKWSLIAKIVIVSKVSGPLLQTTFLENVTSSSNFSQSLLISRRAYSELSNFEKHADLKEFRCYYSSKVSTNTLIRYFGRKNSLLQQNYHLSPFITFLFSLLVWYESKK